LKNYKILLDSFACVTFVDSYLNTDMCQLESSQKQESRASLVPRKLKAKLGLLLFSTP